MGFKQKKYFILQNHYKNNIQNSYKHKDIKNYHKKHKHKNYKSPIINVNEFLQIHSNSLQTVLNASRRPKNGSFSSP